MVTRVADILVERVATLDEPLESFRAVVDLTQREVLIGNSRVGTVISSHDRDTKQVSLRVLLINGFHYSGVMRRRCNGAPSRVTLKLKRSTDAS
jgi:hypothetical protein